MTEDDDVECSASNALVMIFCDAESRFRLVASAPFRFSQATRENTIVQIARSGGRERVLLNGKRGENPILLVRGIMAYSALAPDFQIVPNAERRLKSS